LVWFQALAQKVIFGLEQRGDGNFISIDSLSILDVTRVCG